MRDLRIGTAELPAKDAAHIRALVRLFSYAKQMKWLFVEQPPYDVLVADGALATAPAWRFSRRPASVLYLHPAVVGRKAQAADSIDYPVRAYQFKAWLEAKEKELLAWPSLPVADVPVGNRTRRFKLRRWPPSALLQGDVQRIQWATLLSKNALSVARLAALSGRPDAACAQFLVALKAGGLLVETEHGPADETGSLVPPCPDLTAGPAPPVAARGGLLDSIRRRLKGVWA